MTVIHSVISALEAVLTERVEHVMWSKYNSLPIDDVEVITVALLVAFWHLWVWEYRDERWILLIRCLNHSNDVHRLTGNLVEHSFLSVVIEVPCSLALRGNYSKWSISKRHSCMHSCSRLPVTEWRIQRNISKKSRSTLVVNIDHTKSYVRKSCVYDIIFYCNCMSIRELHEWLCPNLWHVRCLLVAKILSICPPVSNFSRISWIRDVYNS